MIASPVAWKTYGAYADLKALQERVDAKLVARKDHPTMPDVALYNYTQKAQFDKAWDEHVIQARGLVVAADGQILARPFPKFFNHDDPIAPPPWHLPFQAFTKYDGSLFIVADGGRITATRGSFTSDQAEWGRKIIADNKGYSFDKYRTYLFELIHPQNRIVVDYGNKTALVLLAIVDTESGIELPLDHANIGMETACPIDTAGINNAESLLALEQSNAEGFVLRFSNGMRTKIKFSEYKRLHRIVTGASSRGIWETLRDGKPIDEFLDGVPDEFFDFVQDTALGLRIEYAQVLSAAKIIEESARLLPDRKTQAAFIMKHATPRHSAVRPSIFALLDGKDPASIIWRGIEPEWKQPFADRGEL